MDNSFGISIHMADWKCWIIWYCQFSVVCYCYQVIMFVSIANWLIFFSLFHSLACLPTLRLIWENWELPKFAFWKLNFFADRKPQNSAKTWSFGHIHGTLPILRLRLWNYSCVNSSSCPTQVHDYDYCLVMISFFRMRVYLLCML